MKGKKERTERRMKNTALFLRAGVRCARDARIGIWERIYFGATPLV